MSVLRIYVIAVLAAAAALWSGSAQAALKICNETEFVQGVSIGYQDSEAWTSEGWWNVDPGGCATVIAGDLPQQYYYYRAEVDGGDFDGENYFFCTSPQEYTIVGDAECQSRGYDREAFREINVGSAIKDYTLTLVANVAPAEAETADLGLKICNDTADVQGVSIAYEGDEGWTSEGWWNIDPDDCATVIGGELKKRYFYYRAEIDGGPFDAGNFAFCTSPQEYTIVGEQECAARGYDSELFAEIDTGPTAKGFTFTLVSDVAAPVPEKPGNTLAAPVAPVEPVATGGLKICNETAFVQAVSVGYEADAGWTSEGWWNVDPGACSTVIGSALTKQYYYYRAEIEGGEFPGQGYFFCTTPEAYEIVSDTDCEGRGYAREDFAEINVGDGVTDFTFTLVSSEPDAAPGAVTDPAPEATPASGDGLRICNETALVQAVSIGYEADDGWTSEGWWNLEQNQCSTVLSGELKKRYYYYRAEVDGGPFEGEGYNFCTSPQEYTIVGDTECEARGYDREDFAEIDTGPTATSFVFTLVADGSSVADEPELFEETAPEAVTLPDAVEAPATPPEVVAVPEAVPEPEVEPEPEPEPLPDPLFDPAPERDAPATPRRGGSRGG